MVHDPLQGVVALTDVNAVVVRVLGIAANETVDAGAFDLGSLRDLRQLRPRRHEHTTRPIDDLHRERAGR